MMWLSTDWSFFAVFDGHCGSGVSAHCAQNLLPTIIQTEDFKEMSNATPGSDEIATFIQKAIHTGFLKYGKKKKNHSLGCSLKVLAIDCAVF